nr:integrase, catalytic region, zinc finger, CCHC-type, peptidase aspartic, catalytic [Tanacetum cinerariifolium]
MSNTSEDIQAAGSDTRPPMLDRTDYGSWAQHARTYDDIDDNNKARFNADVRTKEDRESQLYDEFERFKMLPGENINEYYVRFYKLVNDMRHIRMTMRNIQLNSKFVNNMTPEWDRLMNAMHLILTSMMNLLLRPSSWPTYHVDVNHEEHEIHNEVQQPIIVDSDTIETGNSNSIPYEQYLKNNEAFVVLNDVSSVLNDDSLATELAIYKEQVEKEDKLLGELVNMKNLKEKFEDKLYKQEQSMQTVHMLCKPKSLYDHENEMALGYQNPYYLNKAKRAQPALYDGHEILKTNYVLAIVPTSEEDLELADISGERMIKKVKDPKSLVKERAMKSVFENIEAEVDQNAIDKKCDEIERKNLLITNKNLIANCIAQEVFYIVTDSVLTASRFHELNVTYDDEESRAVKLEAGNSELLEKIQNDDHDSMVKHFSKLEIDHLN